MKPLDFGELPKVRSTVTTCGYPAGGEQISYTRGVVSRIEVETYSHIQNRSFLVVQTDAAINPGNSGGPVLQEDKVVGVAFQGANGLENTGYFIPTSVIHHFLVDIEDGQYDGFPDAGILFAALENQAYRKRLALPDNGLGSRVDGFLPVPSTQRVLQLDDVILKIGSYPVASDSTVLYEGNRVDLGVIFDGVQNGESVDLKIWRNGQEENVSLPLFIYRKDRAEGAQYDRLPRYYIWGGMVFVALSADYLNTVGNDFTAAADLLYELGFHGYEKPSERREEPVVLASTLAHTVNADIQVRNRALVDKVNGVRIEKLEDLAKAFEGSTNEFDVIEFGSQSRFECMDHKAAEAANADILKSYRIPAKSRL